MQLGAFSMSLAVKDVAVSRAFYEKLGFRVVGGAAEQRFVIMRNGTSTIGLFQGMFEKNTLTFNPGWDGTGQPLTNFEDVRDIQRALVADGVTPAAAADETSAGPAYMMVIDPDGNPVLFDQHVPKPSM